MTKKIVHQTQLKNDQKGSQIHIGIIKKSLKKLQKGTSKRNVQSPVDSLNTSRKKVESFKKIGSVCRSKNAK